MHLVSHEVVKVPVIELCGRDGDGSCGRADTVAETFVSEEEERLPPAVVELGQQHRSAENGAEVVLAIDGHRLGEEAARVEIVVSDEFVRIAVELIGARFGDERNQPAAGAAVLGLEPVSIDHELIDGVERRRITPDQIAEP